MKKWLAIGGLILVTVIWGGGFVASDMALGSMKPFQIMMVRFLLASVLMGMISMGQHKKEGKLEDRAGAIKAGILMGIALFAGFALQIIGLQYTTPSKNAFLTALNVVIVPFIAFIILKKKVGTCRERNLDLCRFGDERNHWSNHVRYWSSTAFFEWKSYTESGRWSYTSLCGRICVPDLFYRRICEKISGICTEYGADDHSICIIGSQSCDFWRDRFSGHNTGMVKCFVSGCNQYDCMLSAPDRMPEVCR